MKQEDWNEIIWNSTPDWRKEQLGYTSDAAALKLIKELKLRIQELEKRWEDRNRADVEKIKARSKNV